MAIPITETAVGAASAAGLRIPGTDVTLEYERDAEFRVLSMRAAGREYLHTADGERIYDNGLAVVSELKLGTMLVRRVRAAGSAWSETYRFDDKDRPVYIDGVEVRRDARGRVIACRDADSRWYYTYKGHNLASIQGPFGLRTIECDAKQRPVQVRQGRRRLEFRYMQGRRCNVPALPEHCHRDNLGRVWTVSNAAGEILHTYLWDGFACLGRIDGPPGAPLAVVYSLDPSLTPVRIISRAAVRRVPRDAFGENISHYADTPGLFGGYQRDGFVYYRARTLDPRTGAFTMPDPWHGGEGDPRRTNGYRGPLITERQDDTGSYAVCRYDPISKADPTGEMAIPAGLSASLLTLSTLTWSAQHLITAFGLAIFNFEYGFIRALLTSIFTGFKDNTAWGRMFSWGGAYSDWLGAYGMRIDPVGIDWFHINRGRAWTFSHVIWAQGEEFDDLEWIHCFSPSAAFRPGLYGSILGAKVLDKGQENTAALNNAPLTFILRGSAPSRYINPYPNPVVTTQLPEHAPGWSRAGGRAERVMPGSLVPWFPEGALHFSPKTNIKSKRLGRLTELHATGVQAAGTVETRLILRIEKTGLAIAVGALLLLENKESEFARVEVEFKAERDGRRTELRFVEDPNAIVHRDKITARGLSAANSEAGLHIGSAPNRLNVASGASTIRYHKGEVVVLKQGAATWTMLIEKLEVKLQVNSAMDNPGGFRPPLKVYKAQAAPGPQNVDVISPTVLEFPAGQVMPAEGTALFINGGAAQQSVKVAAILPGRQCRVEPPLDAAISGSVQWQNLGDNGLIGEWNGNHGSTDLVYEARESGVAPSGGSILVRDDRGTLIAARDIRALGHDEIVLPHNPIPGNNANPYDVDRHTISNSPNESNTKLEDEHVFILAAPPHAEWSANPKPALRLHATTFATLASAIPAGTRSLITDIPVSGNKTEGSVATLTFSSGSIAGTRAPVPGQALLLKNHSGPEVIAVTVKHLRAVLRLKSAITVNNAAGTAVSADLQLFRLQQSGPYYKAIADSPTRLQLLPETYLTNAAGAVQTDGSGHNSYPAHFPQFHSGELVKVMWQDTTPASRTAYCRIGNVEGTLIELEVSTVTNVAAELRVARMEVADPENGSRLAGFDARLNPGGLGNDHIDVKIWQPNTFRADMPIAVSDGSHQAVAVEVDTVRDLTIEYYSIPGSFSSVAARADIHAPLTSVDPVYLPGYTLEGQRVLLDDPSLPAGPNMVFADLFRPQAGALSADGHFLPGSVMIPEDKSESWELNRRESLETHELRHTQQAAWMGPLLLSLIPKIWDSALYDDIQRPEFSQYVQASVLGTPTGLQLEIPPGQGVSFETGDTVQLSQAAGVVTTTLGVRDGNRFALDAGIAIIQSNQSAWVRKNQGPLSDGIRALLGIQDILSVGGLMSTIVGPVMAFPIWLIPFIVSLIKDEGHRGFWNLSFHPARIPDPARPTSVTRDTGEPGLAVHDVVYARAEGNTNRFRVVAIGEGGAVELDQVPPSSGPDRRLEIGKAFSDDPLNFASTALINNMGMGWLRWLFDPFGNLQFTTRPQSGSPEDIFFRVARFFYSTNSWTLAPFGIFFWDNFVSQITSGGVSSWMEQDASEQSGDLYSPLARLYGGPEYVGDLGRYWFYPHDRGGSLVKGQPIYSYRDSTTGHMEAETGLSPRAFSQDAPGVHTKEVLRIMPHVAQSGGGTDQPNEDNVVDPAVSDAGLALPDFLYRRSTQDFRAPSAAFPSSFSVNAAGFIPVSNVLERTAGMYVAFSRPNKYRLTIRNTFERANAAAGIPASATPLDPDSLAVFNARNALKAQKKNAQKIYYEQNVRDVTVSLYGSSGPIANNGLVEVVLCQRFRFEVQPNNDRRYELQVMRPLDSPNVRASLDGYLQAMGTVTAANAEEPVEIVRVHTANAFAPPNRNGRSFPQMHIMPELRIPVRALKIKIVDTLPLRAGQYPANPSISEVRPGGEAWLLVPAEVNGRPGVPARTYTGSAPPNHPALQILDLQTGEKPPAVRNFLGGVGALFKVAFPADDPPEEELQLRWDVPVRATRVSGPVVNGTLHTEITLKPWFRLLLRGGAAGPYTVARGNVLELECSDAVVPNQGAGLVVVSPPDDITIGFDGNVIQLTVAGGATTGIRRVTVQDNATASHKAVRSFEIV